jgi:hypothetical protein
MKTPSMFAILGVLALAACEPVGPPYAGPGWGPPPGPGWGPPPAAPVNLARAERACVAQAEREGLRVRNVGQTEIVTGSRGRVIGSQSIMRVSTGRRSFPVRCNYTFETRVARITPIRRA